MPRNRSALPALPNAIDIDQIEYMLEVFGHNIAGMLEMTTRMYTFIRIRLYRIMFPDFALQELASSHISTR